MVTLTPLRKGEEKKMKKLSQLLELHISETPSAIYLKFGIWDTDVVGASPQQKSSGFVQAAQRYIYTKITLLFPLLYSQVWCAGFLGLTTHYHVS